MELLTVRAGSHGKSLLAADTPDESATETAAQASDWLIPLLVFGGVALLLLIIVQMYRVAKGGMFSANFLKTFGLILVAVLGVGLVAARNTDNNMSAAFALLGTLAGYFAGSQATSDSGQKKTGAGKVDVRKPDPPE